MSIDRTTSAQYLTTELSPTTRCVHLDGALVCLQKHADLSAEDREKIAEDQVRELLRYVGMLERDLVMARNKAIGALLKEKEAAVEKTRQTEEALTLARVEGERHTAHISDLQTLATVIQERDAARSAHSHARRDLRKTIEDEIATRAAEAERLKSSLDNYASP